MQGYAKVVMCLRIVRIERQRVTIDLLRLAEIVLFQPDIAHVVSDDGVLRLQRMGAFQCRPGFGEAFQRSEGIAHVVERIDMGGGDGQRFFIRRHSFGHACFLLERIAHVVMGRSIIRLQGKGLLVGLKRRIVVALVIEHQSDAVMRLCMVGLD